MITKKKNLRKSESVQAILFSILIGIFLIGSVGFLVISNLRISQKRAELNEKIAELKEDIVSLEETNEKLKAGLIESGEDAYWEERIREQGYKKPGEEAVVVLPQEEKGNEAVQERSFWQKLIQKLGF